MSDSKVSFVDTFLHNTILKIPHMKILFSLIYQSDQICSLVDTHAILIFNNIAIARQPYVIHKYCTRILSSANA